MAHYMEDLVDIELENGSLFRSFLNRSIGKGDELANRFGVRLFRHGEAVNIEGSSVQGFFHDPMGNNIAITSGGVITGNVAFVTLPQACYNYEGQFTLAIKIIGGGVTGTMRIIDGVVSNTNTDSAVAPTGAIPTYQEILAVYEQMLAAKDGSVRFDITQSLTDGEKQKARTNIEGASLTELNAEADARLKGDDNNIGTGGYNVISNITSSDGERYGVEFTKNADGSITVEGTSTGSGSYFNAYENYSGFPQGLHDGGKFYASCDTTNVYFNGYAVVNNELVSIFEEKGSKSFEFTIPEDATGAIFRVRVVSGETVDETVRVRVWAAEDNINLEKSIENAQKRIYTKKEITWERGSFYAVGTLDNDSNSARCTEVIKNAEYFEVGSACWAIVLLYKNNGEIYIGKIAEDGSVNKTSGDWKHFTGEVDIRSIMEENDADAFKIAIRRYDGLNVTDENAQWYGDWKCSVYLNKYLAIDSFDKKTESIETLESIQSNPLFPCYMHFKSRVITTDGDGDLVYGETSKVRKSIITRFDKTFRLAMINPDYSFRVFWKDEDDEVRSVTWDTCWDVPGNTDVAISIRRHERLTEESEDISDEHPEYYLVPFKNDMEPKAYFKSEIEDTIQKVKAVTTEPCLCFLMSTDQHFMTVQHWLLKYDSISDMVLNMKAVAKEIRFDGCIALGDIADYKVPYSDSVAERFGIKGLTNYELDAVFYKWMEYAVQNIRSVHPNFIYIPGNHDDDRYFMTDNNIPGYDYTKGEMYSYYTSNVLPERVSNPNNNALDYYIDYPQVKIRMFCIHSSMNDNGRWYYGINDSTVSWMEEQLALIPEGWSVMLLTHMSPVKENNVGGNDYYNFDELKAVIQDFVTNGGSYIATIYGHSHCDYYNTTPWLEIASAAQKCHTQTYDTPYTNMPGAVFPEKVVGTAAEDCWNVIVIRPGVRKINMIRFGAGSDREFSY